MIISIVLSLIFLFGAGYWKGMIVGRNRAKNAVEMLAIGAFASLLLYAVGTLLVFV